MSETMSAETLSHNLVSADSHVVEVPDLWETRMSQSNRDRAPKVYFDEARKSWVFGSPEVLPQAVGSLLMAGQKTEDTQKFHESGFAAAREGGWNPVARLDDMAIDGVWGEVLYPSLGLGLFCMEDADLQEDCFRAYNDWLIDYCEGSPERLYGIALISVYNIEHAVAELTRCQKKGLRGGMIWQEPHERLPFASDHYNPFWQAAQELEMPISLHILTGHGSSKHRQRMMGLDRYRRSIHQSQDVQYALFEIIFSGALERYPGLKVVSVENEVGWMPFWLSQCDKYFHRFGPNIPIPIKTPPSEQFHRQVYATFFNDAVGGRQLSWWGTDNCMWSNDYPHQNSTWPHSRDIIARDLSHLEPLAQKKVIRDNVEKLYGLTLPA